MKKHINLFKTIVIMLLINLSVTNIVTSKTIAPEYVRFSTERKVKDKIYFDGFYLEVEKIQSDIGVAYCLEVEKDYPTNENFQLEGEVSEIAKKVLAVGYPNITIEELKVDNDDDAYVATQVALWSMIEGYNVSSIRGDNAKVIECIKDIYSKSLNANADALMKDVKSYYLNEETQRVALVTDKIVVSPEVIPPVGK